ncbi:MAG: endonuclease/exonuclease/phosphatase family protein [Sulfuricellaceae bacterium]|nr:endonuclease/exonuclease/phosphatase family protein [Sulfuricellaceae bacterium]
MRLVTWNCCRGQYAKKVPLLEPLAPDIAVIQECAKPVAESNRCLWFGDNPRQGVLIQSWGSYTVHPLPPIPDVPKYIIPIQVHGPADFVLFAVWSKVNARYRYVEAVVRAVELYQDLFAASPSVLIGDLNSNAIWDNTHPTELNHSALVKQLDRLGLSSSYHHFFGEAHGAETRPTYYFHWNKQKPFHIDYCFVPVSWVSNIRSVEIGSYGEWQHHSDHRPLLVEVANVA